MKLLFVGTFGLGPKSTIPSRAVPLAAELQRLGHQVAVLLPPWDRPQDSGRVYRVQGVPVINVRLPPPLPFLGAFLLTWRLLREVWRFQADVVHLFKPKGYGGMVGMALLLGQSLRLFRGRLVVDSDDWEGTGGWNQVNPYPWLWRVVFAFQERWLLRHAQAVTVASRTLEELAIQLRGGAKGVHYLPNGYPCEPPITERRAELRQTLGLQKGPVLLLYTRFVEFRVPRLWKLWRGILTSFPEARLLVVGQGLFGEERELLRLAQEDGLAQSVCWVGWVERGLVPTYLHLADVALFPCDDTLLNRAKCPVRLVEMLAFGPPVVAERVGQIAEYICPGETGLLVAPGDHRAFLEATGTLLRDKALRARMQQAARLEVQTHFRWEVLMAGALEAYGL